MASSSDGSSTLLYVAGAAVLVLVLTACCIVGIAGFVFVRARESAPVVERRAVERPVERSSGPLLGGAEPVTLTPPPSLGLAPSPTSDRRTRHVEATVTVSEGSIGVSVGDRCSFDVLVLDRSGPPGHYCRTFAECNGVRIFGTETPRTGFFPCAVYDAPLGVAGEDLEPSESSYEGDPMFQIDTRTMQFLAADGAQGQLGAAYRVIARIDSVTER